MVGNLESAISSTTSVTAVTLDEAAIALVTISGVMLTAENCRCTVTTVATIVRLSVVGVLLLGIGVGVRMRATRRLTGIVRVLSVVGVVGLLKKGERTA